MTTMAAAHHLWFNLSVSSWNSSPFNIESHDLRRRSKSTFTCRIDRPRPASWRSRSCPVGTSDLLAIVCRRRLGFRGEWASLGCRGLAIDLNVQKRVEVGTSSTTDWKSTFSSSLIHQSLQRQGSKYIFCLRGNETSFGARSIWFH